MNLQETAQSAQSWPETAGMALLLDAKAAAALCGVSRSFWMQLHSSGRCPLPVRLGRRVLWRREELARWIAAGCPNRQAWIVQESRKSP